MNENLKEKIKTLPPEVYSYLTSIKSDELNVLIAQKYDLTLEQIRIFADLLPRLFLKEIGVNTLVEEIKRLFGFNDGRARQMACDIAGVRLAVVDSWLGGNIAGLISGWGGDPNKYRSHVAVQQQAVVKEAEWLAKQTSEPEEAAVEEEVDWAQREVKLKEVFGGRMVEFLRLDDNDFMAEINNEIFYLALSEGKENFKNELVNLLFNDQEMLTSQRIVLDGKQVDPTIANWLAYFIKQKGSDWFDTVLLMDFVTNAPNAKPLDEAERQLLINLLIVYRNLKFFPQSMPDPNPDTWEIFPLASVEQPLTTQAPVSAPASAVADVQVAPENAKIKRISELKNLISSYPAGSLEQLALEEEVEKLSKL